MLRPKRIKSYDVEPNVGTRVPERISVMQLELVEILKVIDDMSVIVCMRVMEAYRQIDRYGK